MTLTHTVEDKVLFEYSVPEHVVKRQKEKHHLLDEAFIALNDTTSGLYKKNKNLLQKNYTNHPFVHAGYYDSKKDDVLYVKTDKGVSIPKKSAVLTNEGTFVDLDDLAAITTASLRKCVAGDQEAIDTFQSTWILNQQTGLCYKPKAENIMVTIETRHLAQMFERSCDYATILRVASRFIANQGTFQERILTPFLEMFQRNYDPRQSGRNIGEYVSIRKEPLERTLEKAIQIPSDSPILPNFYLLDSTRPNFKQEMEESLQNTGVENRPCFVINSPQGDSGYRYNRVGRPVNSETEAQIIRFSEDMSININFPIPLAYRDFSRQVGGTESRATSRPTQNNEGVLLNYTAKIDAFKPCFKKTEREEQIHQQNLKDMDSIKQQHASLKAKYVRMKETASTDKDYIFAQKKLRDLGKEPKLPPHKQPIYLGVELELVPRKQVRNEEGYRQIIKDIANSRFGDHCILKSDSSTGTYGFEIVTIPATLAYHKQMFEENYFNKENAFDKRTMATTDCGIHVHISKNVFTKLSLGKFSSFINSLDNAEFIDAMANRKPTHYCQKIPLKGKNSKGFDVSAAIASRVNLEGASLGQFDNDRRVAVNTESNAHTVEVRIFKGSNTKNNIFRKMEFCESLVYFCRSHSLQQMTMYDYINFILEKQNRMSYPHVVKWLASKNYIGHTSAKILGKKRLVHTYSENLVPKPDTMYHKNVKV